MANYHDNGQSFINGLSDFWLLYFKEIDQLRALYTGTEIQVGQSYLDLLGLLLNSSVKDTPIFNKEYWKLFQIRESDIRFKAGTTASRDRYLYTLPNNTVFVRHLNNKILNVTVNLDKDVEFFVNDEDLRLEFTFDPLNAYQERTWGAGNSALSIRSRIAGASPIRVWLDDTGAALSISVVGYDIRIQYDGPANTGTTLVRDIVQQLNTQTTTAGLVLAEIAGLGTGTASPAGTGSYEALLPVAANPLDNFATRTVEQAFGGKLTCNTVTDWVAAGVKKGDIIRLINGPMIGSPSELEINTVRANTLYVEAGETLTIQTGERVNFAIIRAPESNNVARETIAQSGVVVQSGIDATLVAFTRQFSSPTANFNPVHEGDIIEVLGTVNNGYGKILSVIDPFTVTLSLTIVADETPVAWNLLSSMAASNIGVDGVLTNLETGSATFESATAAFTSAAVGTVLKINRTGTPENYQITGYVSPTEITVAAAATVADGTGLNWGWAKNIPPVTTLIYSPPASWPEEGSVVIDARRLVDSSAVQEGIDYDVLVDLGAIKPKTVWETSVTNTAAYRYRTTVFENETALQTGATGTITPGVTNTFSDPTAAFTADHVGYALRVANSGLPGTGATNNGVHTIAAVTSATTVELTTDKFVPSTLDPNNGALSWELLRRGTFTASTVTAPITELISETAFWAPDVLVDRFHLYNTYGYLINRYERSSEEYRALIRGIFQLFMLGPTLERLESAINTVAGLPVIRDNGEILLGYTDNSLDSGVDGVFDYTTRQFSSATAAFTAAHVASYIYAKSGANINKLFKIQTVVNSTTVTLEETPGSDTGVSWELTSTADHTITTSRTTYTVRRDIPLRDYVTDPANIGVHIFRAFEPITTVFEVVDYIEDPTWWEFVQIPEELIPNEMAVRRQSSPVLFENVISPADNAKIGDPGFYIGADSEGYAPASVALRSGAAGVLTGDPFYPLSNTVYFEAATAAFTSSDVGNYVVIGSDRYRIMAVTSATKAQVEAFVDIPDQTGLAWSINTGALPKRYKAAFIILDKVLKYHTFSVRFDLALMNQLKFTLLEDLQDLVFAAKPSYTYIMLTPAGFFEEILGITEELDLDRALILGGDEGEVIAANVSPLLVIGASWRIGSWFRYVDNSSIFAAPAVSIATPLGAPAAGYAHLVNRAYITPTSFTSGGAAIQVADVINTVSGAATTADITVSGGETVLTFAAPYVSDSDVLQYIEITGSGLGNDGTYRIGAVLSTTQVRVSPQASSTEAGLSAVLHTRGSVIGQVSKTSEGEVLFTDLSNRAQFVGGHVGTYIRRPFIHALSNQYFPIYSIVSSTEAMLAEEHRIHPIAADPDISVAISSSVLTCTMGDYVFSRDMAYTDRYVADSSTAKQNQYYIECTSGANSGQRYRIETYIAPNQVLLSGGIDDAAVTTRLIVVAAPECIEEITEWEHVKEQITISADHQTIELSTPAQDVAAAVPYVAYGVREPIDPTTEVFDATSGDTMYSVGMPDPRQARGRSRTGRDTDLREEPIEITRT